MKDIEATVVVNLKRTENEILKGLHKDARWGIGRAKRDGLEIEKGSEMDWEIFYDIYKQTISKGGADIKELKKLKDKSKVLFICKKEGKIIAGAAIKIENDVPILFLNASLGEYQKHQPNNLLYWKCILWSKEKGFEKFDLGGWQINARDHLKGINRFKEKWGEIIYFKRDYPILKAVGRKLIRKSDFLWKVNKKIKKRNG